MKYIITEQQNERLQEIIWRYLDNHLTPFGGWLSLKEYDDEVDYNGGEVFLHLVESEEGWGEYEHMWYSTCDNYNLGAPLKEGTCPVVTIPSAKSEALYGFFGDRWKPVFLEWFSSNTGLPTITVDTQGWG